MTKEELELREKDFKELAKIAEKFINKWGHPHATIIIQQGHIEFLEGAYAMPLEILD